MSWLDAFEIEERVGHLWHRLVGHAPSWPSHPQAAVRLEDLGGQLPIFFRGLGGEAGLSIVAQSLKSSGHRLTWRQKIGMEDERLAQASRDEQALALPPSIDVFADRGQNRDLYFWLAAFFAHLHGPKVPPPTLLARDVDFLARADQASRAALARFPGLAPMHRALCRSLLAARPQRPLKGIEAHVEAHVLALLGGPPAPVPDPHPCPARYRPFLPVPLWGDVSHLADHDPADPDLDDGADGGKTGDDQRRHAERKRQDNADRNDPIILNRFEKVLAFAEMVNVNRAADDTDEEEAKKAADDLDTITLSRHQKKAATKLKFDLDLPPEATDPTRLSQGLLYPEWDWRQGAYLRDHCRIITSIAAEEGEDWQPDQTVLRRIAQVRRQFESLRSKPHILRGQTDGLELDMERLVRARADLAASGQGSDHIYVQRRPMDRDLSVSVLVDASLSTDAWIENRRVLDVEKEALSVLASGLAACGDRFAIHTFTSRKRDWVRLETIKDFSEDLTPQVMRRIAALKPGFYTRIGAAIRHAAHLLEQEPNRHRLLLVITDGKPNDVDHYEGRHGIEDTRKAVQEARAKGLAVFGITIDRKAQSYFPHLFGRGHFAIIHHLDHLSAALPRIYRQLVAS